MLKQLSLENLVNALSVGMCVLGQEQRVLFANPKFSDMLGSPAGALVGKSAADIFEFTDGRPATTEGTRNACLRTAGGKATAVATIAQPFSDGVCLLVLPTASLEAIRWGNTQDRLERVEQLLDRVERIHGGGGDSGNMERDLSASPLLAQLSRREREIVTALVAARPVKQIAATLNISPHTVRNHLKSSFRKLNVGSQVELVAKLTQGPLMVGAGQAS